MRSPSERVRDVLVAIENIERYLPRGRASMQADELLQTWFVRQLEVLGEAAAGIPEDVRRRAPQVPWPKITGMRNVLVHRYHTLDLDLVWDAVAIEVPKIKRHFEALLDDLEP